MKTNYTPDRMVVFCQGTIKPEKIFKLAEKEFGGMKVKGERLKVKGESLKLRDDSERTRSYKKHTHQVHAMLGGRAYALGHEKQLAFFLLNNILGGGSLNSRLNLSLRESKGLVYTVESTYTPLSDTGYWCVYWACDPEDYQQSLGLVRKELDILREMPLTESALRRALVQLRGQLAISAQNQENSALAMAKSMLYRNEAPRWQDIMSKIELTTTEQLQSAALEVFDEQNTFILTYE
jgi:predicted Zn-dependent peptidase